MERRPQAIHLDQTRRTDPRVNRTTSDTNFQCGTLERQERAAESTRRHDDWVAKLERARLDRAAVDDEYFRVLGTRTGLLFDLRDEDSDTEIGVFGTGSTIEIRQTDYPDVPIADIPKQLYAALE